MSTAIAVTGASRSLGRAVLAQASFHGLRAIAVSIGAVRSGDAGAIARELASLAPQAVIHLAGVVPAKADESLADPFAANVAGTRAVLDAAAQLEGGARVILASSASVYGPSPLASITEPHDLNGKSEYAPSKISAERLLRESEVDGCALRVLNIYWPGQHHSLVNRLKEATADTPVNVINFDGFVRDYVHVSDVADAFLRAACRTGIEGVGAVNVGSGQPLSTRELVTRLRAAGFSAFFQQVDGAVSRSVADVLLAENALGWRSQRTVEQGRGRGETQ